MQVKIDAPVLATLDPELRNKAFARMGGETVEAARGAVLVEESDGHELLWFCCPCGCGDIRHFAVNNPTGWELKNPPCPTIKPSIFTYVSIEGRSSPHWHGFLQAGIWVQA